MSRYEISGKVFHIRFYDKDQDRYSSSFQMVVDGNIGMIYGLNGAGFFKCIPLHIASIMRDLEVNTILFTMMRGTYDALSKALSGIAQMEIAREVRAHDRDMLEVRLTLV